ncbi:MAG: molybdenum cofactor biosynthesis protein B [Candidatus Bathyarchaeia archaeon]
MSRSTKKHKAEAPEKLSFAVYTVSTSRFEQQKNNEAVEDLSGDQIEKMLKAAGYTVTVRRLISDSKGMIEEAMQDMLFSPDVDAVVFCGGTGVARRDLTIETVTPFMEKVLPGFGEIFRRLSYDEIGSAAVLSRAMAGVAKGKAFFCVPGSPDAVRLCFEKLILPEAGHIVKHARE